MTPRDERFRQAARQAQFNVLVEAGAGTGKTTLLVDRVIDSILHRAMPLSRILLITFMDKAQEEMRHRLEDRLTQLAQSESLHADERALLQAARMSLPTADITTIHGFCHQVLREYGADYGIPLGFRVMDAIEAEHLWNQTFEEWTYGADSGDRETRMLRLLHAGIGWDQLVSWARQICDWPAVPHLDSPFPDVEKFVSQYRQSSQEFLQRARTGASADDAGLAQIQDVCQQLEWIAGVSAMEWPRMLAQWTRGLSPKGNKKNWQPAQWLSWQKEWVGELKEDLARLRERMADAYLADWVGLIGSEFRAVWRRARFERLALTFDDLLWEAERISRVPAVSSDLSNRYDLVMVDEFQDTDAIQSAIIRRLVASLTEESLSQQEPGRLFLVGDPKQSIYRFRGADVEVYAEMREQLRRSGGQVLPISENFRCHPQILDYVNRVFSQRWPATPDSERPFMPPFTPLTSVFPQDERKRVGVERLAVDEPLRVRRRAEGDAIAALIEQAIREQWPVRDVGGTRPIGYGDIALIVPQRTGIDWYRQSLERMGIPLASQSGRAFFLQDEIRGLRHLFRALANPEDEVAVVGWLLSPWVAFDHEILARHLLEGGSWNYRDGAIGHQAVREWWRRLSDWHQRFWQVDAETVMDWALAASSLGGVLRERGDAAALANLAKMRQLSRELGDRWGIFEFATWFDRQVQEEVPFEEAPLASSQGQVLMSTVHQSKGLEWPMVIVANWRPKRTALESGIHYNPRLNRVALKQDPWKSGDWDILDGDHRVREEAEGDRLLYVALTRARDYLWFYTSLLDEEP